MTVFTRRRHWLQLESHFTHSYPTLLRYLKLLFLLMLCVILVTFFDQNLVRPSTRPTHQCNNIFSTGSTGRVVDIKDSFSEVSVSNLGPVTCCPEVFVVFLSSSIYSQWSLEYRPRSISSADFQATVH